MIKYRKRIGRSEPWHFFPGCPDWPRHLYVEQDEIPLDELCIKCIEARADSEPESSGARRVEAVPAEPRALWLAPVFRKAPGANTWHALAACSMWPRKNFVEAHRLPRAAKLCNECKTRLVQRN